MRWPVTDDFLRGHGWGVGEPPESVFFFLWYNPTRPRFFHWENVGCPPGPWARPFGNGVCGHDQAGTCCCLHRWHLCDRSAIRDSFQVAFLQIEKKKRNLLRWRYPQSPSSCWAGSRHRKLSSAFWHRVLSFAPWVALTHLNAKELKQTAFCFLKKWHSSRKTMGIELKARGARKLEACLYGFSATKKSRFQKA